MKHGKNKFTFYLEQLQADLVKAFASADPAIWLFENKTRNILFMLEALSRFYAEMHNKKRFVKMTEDFKLLEDLIGKIDYYDYYAKEFSVNYAIPKYVSDYLTGRKEENAVLLNKALKEEKWMESEKIKKMRKKLEDADWLDGKEEAVAIRKIYDSEIEELNKFYYNVNGKFTELEDQVHSIRRKLRWLSIYAQALRGSIQLTGDLNTNDSDSRYLTPEIISSPFNKLPEPGNHKYVIQLNRPHFLALSWVIAELGDLKDKGLALHAIQEVKDNNPEMNMDVAIMKSIASPGEPEEAILAKATMICEDFFQEQNLEKMLGDVVKL